MAAGDVLLDPDGNVILDDDGNVMLSDGLGDDCCCAPVADPCSNCAVGTTPAQVTVTAVDIVLCPGCTPFTDHLALQVSSAFNATACLAQVGPCDYNLMQPIGSLFEAYHGGLCGEDGFPMTHIEWQASRFSSTSWILVIDAYDLSVLHPTYYIPIFSGVTAPASTNCSISRTAANDQENTGCAGEGEAQPFGGRGGTATITPGC